jgi:hypothetical protein
MTEKQKVKAEIEELFKVNLNGGWQVFKSSCDEIKQELEELTLKEMRALKQKIQIKIDSSTLIGSSGTFGEYEVSEK